MVKYTVTHPVSVNVRAAPSPDAPIVGEIKTGIPFEGELAGDSGFVKVTSPPPPGFVVINRVQADLTEPEPILEDEHFDFVVLVTRSARDNESDRNYLLARAYFATKKLGALGKAGESQLGPFQFTAKEWTDAISTYAKDLNLSVEDRLRWRHQTVVAARRAAGVAKALEAKLKRVPTYAEIYFTEEVGPHAVDALAGNLDAQCTAVIADGHAADSYSGKLKATDKTIKTELDVLMKGLQAGLSAALETVEKMPADMRFLEATDADAPWLVVAEAERARNVAEMAGTDANPRIVAYHAAAGIGPNDETPWCASFVTYCMKECGVEAVKQSVPKTNPAWVWNWVGWGRAVAQGSARAGTLILLENIKGDPQSGHIGFLAEDEKPGDTTVQLLGGNQGNRLGIDPFAASKITHRLWMDVGTEISLAQFVKVFPESMHPAEWALAISEAWKEFGITSPIARAGFLGITGNETGGYVGVRRENMNYSAEQAAKTFKDARVPGTKETPNADCINRTAAKDEATFANWIYANKLGNGNEASGDGYKYRGGGIIQLTGRDNYKACAAPDALNLPELAEKPELVVADFKTSARAAAWFIVKHAKIRDELANPDDGKFLEAALKVGLPANETTEPNRLRYRAAALRAFGIIP